MSLQISMNAKKTQTTVKEGCVKTCLEVLTVSARVDSLLTATLELVKVSVLMHTCLTRTLSYHINKSVLDISVSF